MDRHDITHSRTGTAPLVDSATQEQVRLLSLILDSLTTADAGSLPGKELLCATSATVSPQHHIDHPVIGVKRYLLQRNGEPLANTTIPTTGGLVASPNMNRLGGYVINIGTNPITLYLGGVFDELGGGSPSSLGGYPSLWLAGGGGNWDFEYGEILWCGGVWGVASTTSATLAGGEF
jgi:hypothetical protein